MTSDIASIQVVLQQATTMVERLDKGVAVDPAAAEALIQQAQTALMELVQPPTFRGTPSQVAPTASSTLVRKRAESLLQECTLLTASLERSKKRAEQALRAKTQREQLLGSLSTANYFNKANDNETTLLAREEQALRHSRNKVRSLVEESTAVLSALKGQGQRIGGSNSKLGEIVEALGISNHTILAIVRTNRVDAWIVYVGVLLMMMLMWYLWFR